MGNGGPSTGRHSILLVFEPADDTVTGSAFPISHFPFPNQWPLQLPESTTSKPESLSSETSFDLARKRERLAQLENEQIDPSFWSNQERARGVVQEIKSLRAWVTPAD